ncbi:MAG TPA: TonB-dependent receptor plug domain-containing protein, partial [Burkholderiales bacterium]|nr:TonB-dependent receptor plug domain-containing protein [Burkholderiales bacterium]
MGVFSVAACVGAVCAPPAAAADPDVVVTATRFPEKALDAPAGLTVITAEQIARSPAATLPDLLATQAGIVARDNTGTPDKAIDLRGMGITGDQNTLVLLNGQRLNEIELVTIRWSAIPLDSIERIEIMRGSGSVLYGGGATGGTINIVTKTPAGVAASGYHADAGTSFGTFNTRETRVNGARSGDIVSFSLHANNYSSDNYRDNNRLEQQNAAGEVRLRHGLGEAWFNFGMDNQSLRLPGERTAAQLQTDPRGTSRPGDYSARDGGHAALGSSFNLGFGELVVDLSYRDSVRTALLKDYAFGIFNTYTDTRVHTWSLTPRLKVPFRALGFQNSLVLGIDADDW